MRPATVGRIFVGGAVWRRCLVLYKKACLTGFVMLYCADFAGKGLFDGVCDAARARDGPGVAYVCFYLKIPV